MSYHERQERLFGQAGQERIAAAKVMIVGSSGLGSPLAQGLAYLGVRDFTLCDAGFVKATSLNRMIGATPGDLEPAQLKVDVVERQIKFVAPDARVRTIPTTFITAEGFSAVAEADYVFGAVDLDGPRRVLAEVCAVYAKPYFDLATEIDPEAQPVTYGGRVLFASEGRACLHCADELDAEEVSAFLMSESARRAHEDLYGLAPGTLADSGPSVVGLNGIVANLAINEFMAEVTGLRAAHQLLRYAGERGIITNNKAPCQLEYCPVCSQWGAAAAANVERYLQALVAVGT